ncbi:MAG: hypothetical protein A4E66_00833 [Syntrophus sp. PtaB.Bin001]|jgi:uncharacterized protein YoxC|nr:MAG: hypothetical protein A4E66_00833 [Syntrophus sp. PtaB.Bin001]
MNLEIFLYILLGFSILIIIFVLPLLYQLWRTVDQFNITLRTLNQRLPSILANMEEITGNLNEATRNVNTQINELSSAFQRAYALFNTIRSVEQAVQSRMRFSLSCLLRNALPLFKGAQAFIKGLTVSSKTQE